MAALAGAGVAVGIAIAGDSDGSRVRSTETTASVTAPEAIEPASLSVTTVAPPTIGTIGVPTQVPDLETTPPATTETSTPSVAPPSTPSEEPGPAATTSTVDQPL
jgi:hypothetical protein